MTTKLITTISFTDDNMIVIEARTRQGLRTKVVQKDANANTNVGEAIMSFAPPIPPEQPPSPQG